MNYKNILDRYYEFSGGRDKWKNLNSFSLEIQMTSLDYENINNRLKFFLGGKDKWRFEKPSAKDTLVMIRNGQMEYKNLMGSSTISEVIKSTELPFMGGPLTSILYLLRLEERDPSIRLEDDYSFEGIKCYRLTISNESSNNHFLFDKESFKLVSREIDGKTGEYILWFEDYKDFTGHYLPTKLFKQGYSSIGFPLLDSLFQKEQGKTLISELVNFQPNPELSEELFKIPDV